MKMRLIIALAVVAVFFAAVAKAGPLDFVRDQLGVNATNFPFGSSPSAFPQFHQKKGVKQSPADALYEYTLPEKPAQTNSVPVISFSKGTNGQPDLIAYNWSASFEPPDIRLHFTNNKLDWIEIWTGGKERNDKLLAEFAKLSKTDVKTITGPQPYGYSDGQYQLTYRGLCSASENGVAVFRLTKFETPK